MWGTERVGKDEETGGENFKFDTPPPPEVTSNAVEECGSHSAKFEHARSYDAHFSSFVLNLSKQFPFPFPL